MTRNASSYLPNLLGPVEIQDDGTAVISRAALSFDGFTVTSDEETDTITVASLFGTDEQDKLDGLQAQGASVAIAALDVDWSLSQVFYKTLAAGGNTFTFSNATDGWGITVILTGAASTVTWPTVKWPGGVAPTQTASGVDVYSFVKRGSTIYGAVNQDMS